jgi:GTP cyclohydrolase IA
MPEFEKSDSILASTPMDVPRIERAVREILIAMGEDPDREGLRRTPRRFAKVLAEVCGGMHLDTDDITGRTFTEDYNEIILVRDIPFASLCEHHLMPFTGLAHVAYIPRGKVLGLSKLSRVVDAFASRLQVQERLTNQVADLIAAKTRARAVAVVLEATHTCTTIRGVRKAGSLALTSALRGIFLTNVNSRNEVMSLIGKRV